MIDEFNTASVPEPTPEDLEFYYTNSDGMGGFYDPDTGLNWSLGDYTRIVTLPDVYTERETSPLIEERPQIAKEPEYIIDPPELLT